MVSKEHLVWDEREFPPAWEVKRYRTVKERREGEDASVQRAEGSARNRQSSGGQGFLSWNKLERSQLEQTGKMWILLGEDLLLPWCWSSLASGW